MREMPMFAAGTYSSSTASIDQLWDTPENAAIAANMAAIRTPQFGQQMQQRIQQQAQIKEVKMQRRIVQVYIADTNEHVPLDHCLLYKGEAKLTDATDQELFFEIDIRSLLEEHNKKRVTFIDKSVKERTEHLEPAKVRDLKMTVVTVANL